MDLDRVLAEYRVRSQCHRRIDQGSSNTNWIVKSDDGTRFLLRRYARPEESSWNRIICTSETVQYEHEVLCYAAQHGIPCIPPMENGAGATITEMDGALYALFPYIPNDGYRPAPSVRGVREAQLLGRYHNVMESYPVTGQRPGWGYAGQLAAWFHENQLGVGTMDELLDWVDTTSPDDETHAYVQHKAASIRELATIMKHEFPGHLYDEYPIVVNHGDYISRNIGISGDRLVLFDLDSCVRELRIYDLAMLIGYTAGEPHTAREIDAQVAHRIVRAYRDVADMTDDELGLAPFMLIAFRLRIFMGNLGILRTTSSYNLDLIKRNLKGLRWLMDHRQDISSMLTRPTAERRMH